MIINKYFYHNYIFIIISYELKSKIFYISVIVV